MLSYQLIGEMKLWTIYHVCWVNLEDEVWKLWALQCTNFVMMSSEISIGYFFTRVVKTHSKYFYGTSRLFTRLHDMSLVNPIYKSSCDNVETVYISKNSVTLDHLMLYCQESFKLSSDNHQFAVTTGDCIIMSVWVIPQEITLKLENYY